MTPAAREHLQQIALFGQRAMRVLAEADGPLEDDWQRFFLINHLLLMLGENVIRLRRNHQNVLDGIDQPWSRIVGVRNLIAHQYDDLVAETVENIVKDFILGLVEDLRSHLSTHAP